MNVNGSVWGGNLRYTGIISREGVGGCVGVCGPHQLSSACAKESEFKHQFVSPRGSGVRIWDVSFFKTWNVTCFVHIRCFVLCPRHAQALAAIKAYSHWLLQLYTESTRINQETDQFYNIVVTLIDTVSQLTNKQVGQQRQWLCWWWFSLGIV